MTPESLKNAATASKQMNLEEAYKILGSDSNAGIEEVMKVTFKFSSRVHCSVIMACTPMVVADVLLCRKHDFDLCCDDAAICAPHATEREKWQLLFAIKGLQS